MRNVAWFSLVLALGACGSDGGDGPADQVNIGGASSSSDACPDVSGAWKVSEHCDASLVDLTLTVTERECALSFAAPFDQFSGTVDRSGQISLDGPQTCRGDATANAVSMVCTPGTCRVVLSR